MVVAAIADSIKKSVEFKNRAYLIKNFANDVKKSKQEVELNNSVLTEAQELRQEGKKLREQEKLNSRKKMFKAGLNRPCYSEIKDCGYMLYMLIMSYFGHRIASILLMVLKKPM